MDYPLYRNSRDQLILPSGRQIEEFSVENLANGKLNGDDLGIHRDVLLAQAFIAEKNRFLQLAENFKRAAELTAVPDEELLRIYEALRPGRMDRTSLQQLAQTIEDEYGAALTANFIREAAEVA
jgi:propanediol dehydratase small subunit